MLNSYKLALKHLNFNLHTDVDFQIETGRSDTLEIASDGICLLYTSPSPRDVEESRMPSSA